MTNEAIEVIKFYIRESLPDSAAKEIVGMINHLVAERDALRAIIVRQEQALTRFAQGDSDHAAAK